MKHPFSLFQIIIRNNETIPPVFEWKKSVVVGIAYHYSYI